MIGFFWRIFLSAWIMFVSSVSLAVWLSSQYPRPGLDTDERQRVEQIADLVARDLRRSLAAGSVARALDIVGRQVLDLAPLVDVYVLDPTGRDALGRSLPAPVAALRSGAEEGVTVDGRSVLVVRTAGLDGYVVAGFSGRLMPARSLLRPGGRTTFLVVAVLASMVASYLLARFIVVPVQRLQQAGQRVAAGDLNARVAHTVGSRTDDIARLARDFDVMTERVKSLLDTQQRMLRDVSHELRSPLARLQAVLSLARQRSGGKDVADIDRMESELERLDDLIGEILRFSRLQSQEGIARHPTDVVDLVQNIVDDASLEAQADAKQIRFDGPERCVRALDSSLLHSAIENVVRNAVRHASDQVLVTVEAHTGAVEITVADDGPGVPDAVLARLFEPFYRVSDSRGTNTGSGGIGLAIAARSVRLHDGTIGAENRRSGGLRVTIRLPAAAAGLQAQTA